MRLRNAWVALLGLALAGSVIACGGSQETYLVSDDGKNLGNVFVYVKDGLGNYVFDTPTESAKIDQQNCRYHPHVFGMRVGRKLEIINSDPTLHNIHAMPKGNSEFNT